MISSKANEERALYVPRNMQIVVAKYLSTTFLLIGATFLEILLKIVLLGRISSYDTAFFISTSLMSVVSCIIGLILFYIPERYRTRVIFDKDNNLLKIIIRGHVNEVKFDGVMSITSKSIGYPYGGTKHILILNKDSTQIELFKEQCAWRGSHWVAFSEKLSNITGLALSKERWGEDFNGKLHRRTLAEQSSSKRLKWLILIPGLLPMVCAIAYKVDPTRETFILFGLTTILIGNSLSIIFFMKSSGNITNWVKKRCLV